MSSLVIASAVAPVARPRPSRTLPGTPRRASLRAPIARAPMKTQASAVEVGWLLAEAASKAGSVEAPPFVLPLAALVIAVVGGGSAILLKPGDDAAREMRERDQKKFNKKD